MTYRSEHPYVDAPQSPWTRYAFCCPHLLSSKLLPRLFTSVTGSTIHLMDQNRNQKVSLNSCLFLNPYLLSIKVHLGMGGGGESTDENHIFQPPLQLGVTIQLFRPKRWKQKCMELPDSCLERLTQPLPSPPSCLPHFLTKKKKKMARAPCSLGSSSDLRTEATAEGERDRRSLVLWELYKESYQSWTA